MLIGPFNLQDHTLLINIKCKVFFSVIYMYL